MPQLLRHVTRRHVINLVKVYVICPFWLNEKFPVGLLGTDALVSGSILHFRMFRQTRNIVPDLLSEIGSQILPTDR